VFIALIPRDCSRGGQRFDGVHWVLLLSHVPSKVVLADTTVLTITAKELITAPDRAG
jgi:hypothetical protein